MSYGSTDTFSIERHTGAGGYNTVLLADSSNNVGIGKVPSTKLDVNGTVTGTAFAGDGSQLTNINEAALSITESQISSSAKSNRFIASWKKKKRKTLVRMMTLHLQNLKSKSVAIF
jgi:hypothetical protein